MIPKRLDSNRIIVNSKLSNLIETHMNIEPYRPNYYFPSVCDIDFAKLAQQGITTYCFDLDNTLVPQTSHELAPRIAETIKQARANGYIQKICLLSNIIWGQKRLDRLAAIAEELNIEHYFGALFWQRKPKPTGFRWVMQTLESTPEEIAMIGDQIFSDIVGANTMDFTTILVDSLGTDHWSTLITGRRVWEKHLRKQFNIPQKKSP